MLDKTQIDLAPQNPLNRSVSHLDTVILRH
jgi:hypothetical protein